MFEDLHCDVTALNVNIYRAFHLTGSDGISHEGLKLSKKYLFGMKGGVRWINK